MAAAGGPTPPAIGGTAQYETLYDRCGTHGVANCLCANHTPAGTTVYSRFHQRRRWAHANSLSRRSPNSADVYVGHSSLPTWASTGTGTALMANHPATGYGEPAILRV